MEAAVFGTNGCVSVAAVLVMTSLVMPPSLEESRMRRLPFALDTLNKAVYAPFLLMSVVGVPLTWTVPMMLSSGFCFLLVILMFIFYFCGF
jgi:hypothetical protein